MTQPMKTVNMSTLRRKLSDLVKEAEKGATIYVEREGEVVGALVHPIIAREHEQREIDAMRDLIRGRELEETEGLVDAMDGAVSLLEEREAPAPESNEDEHNAADDGGRS